MEKSRSRAQENTRENATVNAKGKYETSHPVLSLRLTAGEMTKLKSAADKTGRKLTDIVKEGAGLGATTTDRAYQQGFKQGYREGFEAAKQKYAV
jgi:flagellar biosynthesis/type III secretory pathway protein FliH